MSNKGKKILIVAVASVVLLAIVTLIIVHFSYYKFSFTSWDGTKLSNKTEVEVALGQTELPKVTAIYTDLRHERNGAPATVESSGTIDLEHSGEYVVTYTASYNDRENAIDVVYKVVDKTAPVITLKGGNEISWALGTNFVDPGYTAVDNVDGDVTANVEVSGNVDINAEGTYTLTYKVSDSSKNEATAERTVHVKKPTEVINAGDKIVYLTFDDGPGPYTQKLLDILDKYGVKVTFFTTDAYPGHEAMIAEEAKRGHTVAIHTFSHDYAKVYASDEAYFDDLNKMNALIKQQTGKESKIIRFPGGSSNEISKKYSQGIMSRLTQEVTNKGFLYDDWNVSSGDAGETTDTAKVVQNVINGIQKHNESTVLQHDIKEFSVNAVEQIIQWGLANGYKFLPITENSPMEHHHVNN